MNLRTFASGAALIAVTAFVTSTVVSYPDEKAKPGAPEHGQPAMTPEQQDMMNKWMAFATPGENHKLLAYKVGHWTNHVKMWESPDQTPSESDGVSEFQLIMDDRYLLDSTKGTFMDQPFLGMGVSGYDNLKKKFVWTWIDNMGTGIAYGEGTYDAKLKTFSYKTEFPDVMTGKYIKSTGVEKILSDDQWVMEAWRKDKDGKEWKCFEVTYTRVK